jgi:hypothetical protein
LRSAGGLAGRVSHIQRVTDAKKPAPKLAGLMQKYKVKARPFFPEIFHPNSLWPPQLFGLLMSLGGMLAGYLSGPKHLT